MIKNPKMLRYVPNHLKTKRMIRYIPDRYKTQAIFDKVILDNRETLMFVSCCFKNQKMCNTAVDNYDHAVGFVPDSYKTHKNVQ